MINVDLNGTEGGILDTKNDYRQVAIIANPKILNDSNTMSNLVFSQVTVLTLAPSSTSTDYVKDELGITDKYEIEDKVDEIQSEISEWFTYGEYLTIEYNFETKQMSIVKKK